MSRAALLSLAVSLAVTGCGARHATEPSSVSAEAVNRIPFASLQDWVSYGTQVAEVKVVAEREPDVPPRSTWITSPTSSRVLTVSVLDTLWTAPGTTAVQGALNVVTEGWVYRKTGRSVIRASGAPRLEPDQSYVIVFSEFDGVIAPIADSAVLHLDAEHRIELAPGQSDEGPRALDGLTPAEAGERLASVRPDPAAESRRSLPPEERWHAVEAERRSRAS